MTKLALATIFLTLLAASTYGFNLASDNPDTLIGSNSKSYVLNGISLDLTLKQVKKLVKKNDSMRLVKDKYNKNLYHIYSDIDEGSKNIAAISLLWENTREEMINISIFPEYKGKLNYNFERSLTLDAVNNRSFITKFFGNESRREVTLDLPELEMKHTSIYYDDIGVKVVFRQTSKGNSVVLGLYRTK
ncbi:hypothetical protein [Reinekea sp.]|uniref:hypothetical protein n=1 Tax=Reinekea sp. TaxID=1970455 RepID=UPI003988FF33